MSKARLTEAMATVDPAVWEYVAELEAQDRKLTREIGRLREATNLALMHLEDSRAIAAVRAALNPIGEDEA